MLFAHPYRRLRKAAARRAALLLGAALLLITTDLAGQEVREERATQRARGAMVERQLAGRDIDDPRVLEVMGRVQRHLFVPERIQGSAYRDSALPIDDGQTISQPYIVALMTQTLELQPEDRVLEVGTGSGYQAAVLAELVEEVVTIEIRPLLPRAVDGTAAAAGLRQRQHLRGRRLLRRGAARALRPHHDHGGGGSHSGAAAGAARRRRDDDPAARQPLQLSETWCWYPRPAAAAAERTSPWISSWECCSCR